VAGGVALAPNGDIVLVGNTRSRDFATSGLGARDEYNAFIARLENGPPPNGLDTIGVVSGVAAWFLRDLNTGGPADHVFTYGPLGLGWVPIAGDWDGDGTTTVGLYAQSTGSFFLRNTTTPGPADVVFSYGPPGLTPVVGNWNGL
jgi:hypothetical protein